jgi:SAM-dependent methyltransferase
VTPPQPRPRLPDEQIEWARRTRRHPRPTQPDFFVLRRLVQSLSTVLAELPGPVETLDVFCGTRPYEDLLPAGSRVTGFDIDNHYGRADVTGTDFLPFEGSSYDLILFTEGFFYLPEPVAAAEELRRVARPGGTVVITLPLVWEYDRRQIEHRFTSPSLASVFEAAGWEDVRTLEVGGYAVSWALLSGRILRAGEEVLRDRGASGLRPLFAALYLAMNAVAVLADRFERLVWRPGAYTLPPDILLTARNPTG